MTKIRIDSEIMIIGDGELIKNASIIYEGSKIIYAGEMEHAPPVDRKNTLDAPVVMPGLWECHGHFFGMTNLDLEKLANVRSELLALRSVWDVNAALKMGFTSVREVGGFGIHLNKAIQGGFIQGPRIYGAGRILSMTGGHADLHSLPIDFVNSSRIPLRLVDGIAGCYKGVREQIREGAEVIKFCASGGVMSKIDHPIHQQFSNEEQKAIVEEAARADIAVAAHCHGEPGIKSALNAGVKTIEHGSYLTEELADLMIDKDAMLIPTRYVIEKIFSPENLENMPKYAYEKGSALYQRHFESLKIAIKKGVTIAMGTDIILAGPNKSLIWGENAMELEFYVKAGMKPMDAIITATKHGPLTLGKRAPKSGQLKADYDADILILKENPIDDISSLYKQDNIINVIKQGNYVKM
jgi:imidazolonepropionase-like amidohydrolase